MKKTSAQLFLAKIPENLRKLADICPFPLYIVGGSIRDFLAGYPLPENTDWDISAPAEEGALLAAAKESGFTARAVYRATGTVKLEDSAGKGYEFSRFRSDKYVRGVHTPVEIFFTEDINLDARRRDFCANAVYFDIKSGEFLDPLGGIPDIEKRTLRTVAPAEKVFGEDGLRLMRLARISAQTGFMPDTECLEGAKRNAALVKDIAAERIFTELQLLLHADALHGDPIAPYRGLSLLRETGVLREIIPELALGDKMPQRADFHDHDVLEHSIRCVRYAPPEIRLAALLHDVGKPFCFLRDGNFHAHPEEGARIARDVLTRLKAPKKVIAETETLVRVHMRDFNLLMKPNKVRRELVECRPLLDELFALKQADYSACKDDLSPAPAATKWRAELQKMKAEGAPLSLKELAVDGKDAKRAGIPPVKISEVLEDLLFYCAFDGARNDREHLLKRLKKIAEKA